MELKLKDLIMHTFKYWECSIGQVDSNIFRIQVDKGSVAEKICEANGRIFIGTDEFEDDTVSEFDVWRSFSKGSYYLDKLLEELRSGPLVGYIHVNSRYRSPSMDYVFPKDIPLITKCSFEKRGKLKESNAKVIIFHFVINFICADPETKFISLAIDKDTLKILPEAVTFPKGKNLTKTKIEASEVNLLLPVVIDELGQNVNKLIENYKNLRSNTTIQAIRKIRSAKEAEIKEILKHFTPLELEFRKREIEEIWNIREENARSRSIVESVDVSLVAATIQNRPITIYSNTLSLTDNRSIEFSRIYDRFSNWLEPFSCDQCGRDDIPLFPGSGSCHHLICKDCIVQYDGCSHISCESCKSKCQSCGKIECFICGYHCSTCNSFSCSNHVIYCSSCDNKACKSCSLICSICKNCYCIDHGTPCMICGQIMCSTHLIHDHDKGIYRISVESFQLFVLAEIPDHIIQSLWNATFEGITWQEFFSDILWDSIIDNISWDSLLPEYKQFRGRKKFFKFIKDTIGSEQFLDFYRVILKCVDNCEDIWIKKELRLINLSRSENIENEFESVFRKLEYYKITAQRMSEMKIRIVF